VCHGSDRSFATGDRLCVENRAGSANLAEAQAFMDDDKRILLKGGHSHPGAGPQQPHLPGTAAAVP